MFYGKNWPANSLYEVGRLIFLSVDDVIELPL